MSFLRGLKVDNYLFIEIITVSRTDWSKMSTFTDKNVLGSVTALAMSSNGVYLASASQSRVHIWSTQTRRVIAKLVLFRRSTPVYSFFGLANLATQAQRLQMSSSLHEKTSLHGQTQTEYSPDGRSLFQIRSQTP